eukprot:TRINITY_DN6311_c0_g1_i1.p1 TRINITY_DN6311_c0_g1~~TRINITY_DN6311_c0_g1_i1.p1  ORF type:complete len:152 (+),score=6.52 TRINITY_DN6311_c0_g1_i1:16-471(+)
MLYSLYGVYGQASPHDTTIRMIVAAMCKKITNIRTNINTCETLTHVHMNLMSTYSHVHSMSINAHMQQIMNVCSHATCVHMQRVFTCNKSFKRCSHATNHERDMQHVFTCNMCSHATCVHMQHVFTCNMCSHATCVHMQQIIQTVFTCNKS